MDWSPISNHEQKELWSMIYGIWTGLLSATMNFKNCGPWYMVSVHIPFYRPWTVRIVVYDIRLVCLSPITDHEL